MGISNLGSVSVLALSPRQRSVIERDLQPNGISTWDHRRLSAVKTTFCAEVKGTSGPAAMVCQSLDSSHHEGSDLADPAVITTMAGEILDQQ